MEAVIPLHLTQRPVEAAAQEQPAKIHLELLQVLLMEPEEMV